MAKKNKDKYIDAAQKFQQKQQYDKAIKEYEKAFEEDRKDARIAKNLGDLYLKVKKPQDSIKFYRQAASSYAKDGFYPKAIAVNKQILDLDESLFEVRLDIADLQAKLGLMSDAIVQYRTALDKFEKEGKADRVLEISKKMVDIEPHNPNNRVKLAECYFKANQRDQGYTEFRKASDDLKKSQRWDDLIKLYERLTQADPTNPDNYLGFGDALMERGELERAFQAYHQVLKYRPEDIDAMEKVASVSIRLKDTQNAVTYLKKLATIAENKKDVKTAQTYYQRIYKLQPDADIKAKLGDKATAAPPVKAKAPEPVVEDIREDEVTELEEAPPDIATALSELQDDSVIEATEPAVESGLIEGDMAPPTQDQVPGLITEIDVYLKYGLLDKAEQYARRILSAFPDNHQASRLNALIDKEKGDIKKAVKGLLRAAQMARANNAHDDARICAEETLALEPSNSQAQALMAELDSGVEIPIGLEGEVEDEAKPRAAAIEEAETISMEIEQPEDQLSFVEERAVPNAAGDKIDLEPFSFVEEADEQLVMAEEVRAPAPPPKPAPPKIALKPPAPPRAPQKKAPVIEIENDGPILELESEAPVLELETQAPIVEDDRPLEFIEEAPASQIEPDSPPMEMEDLEPLLELSTQVPAEAAKPEPPAMIIEEEEEEIEEISLGEAIPPSPPEEVVESPKAPPASPKAPSPPDFVLEMDEAEFYAGQGLAKEAERIYREILAVDPEFDPAKQKLNAIAQAAGAPTLDMPILDEIEEIELEEEVELEEFQSLDNAVEAAEGALGDTFKEEKAEAEISDDSLEEVALESQPVESLPEPEALEEAEPETIVASHDEPGPIIEEEISPEPLITEPAEEVEEQPQIEAAQEEELPVEVEEEPAPQPQLETQPPELEEEPEPLVAAGEDEEVQLEVEEEPKPEVEAHPPEIEEEPRPDIEAQPPELEEELEATAEFALEEKTAPPEIEEKPEPLPEIEAEAAEPEEKPEVLEETLPDEKAPIEPQVAAPANLDLEDEWAEEAPATEIEKEAPSPEQPVAGDTLADAADEAWGEALEPESEESPAQVAEPELHQGLNEVAEAADEAFGSAFGEDSQEIQPEAKEGGFDLSSVIEEAQEAEPRAPSREAEHASADDVGAILESFRERVHDQIGHDATAHFDLGIAYKEMGLLDEAINSFRTALKSGANPAQCLTMIGLCFVDQKELNKAESVLREGLKEKKLTERENISLKYELGLVLEEQSRLGDALEIFREVAKVSATFRDVEIVIIRLEERLGGPDKGSQRQKISYI